MRKIGTTGLLLLIFFGSHHSVSHATPERLLDLSIEEAARLRREDNRRFVNLANEAVVDGDNYTDGRRFVFEVLSRSDSLSVAEASLFARLGLGNNEITFYQQLMIGDPLEALDKKLNYLLDNGVELYLDFIAQVWGSDYWRNPDYRGQQYILRFLHHVWLAIDHGRVSNLSYGSLLSIVARAIDHEPEPIGEISENTGVLGLMVAIDESRPRAVRFVRDFLELALSGERDFNLDELFRLVHQQNRSSVPALVRAIDDLDQDKIADQNKRRIVRLREKYKPRPIIDQCQKLLSGFLGWARKLSGSRLFGKGSVPR